MAVATQETSSRRLHASKQDEALMQVLRMCLPHYLLCTTQRDKLAALEDIILYGFCGPLCNWIFKARPDETVRLLTA